jgi:hypothetical protein
MDHLTTEILTAYFLILRHSQKPEVALDQGTKCSQQREERRSRVSFQPTLPRTQEQCVYLWRCPGMPTVGRYIPNPPGMVGRRAGIHPGLPADVSVMTPGHAVAKGYEMDGWCAG